MLTVRVGLGLAEDGHLRLEPARSRYCAVVAITSLWLPPLPQTNDGQLDVASATLANGPALSAARAATAATVATTRRVAFAFFDSFGMGVPVDVTSFRLSGRVDDSTTGRVCDARSSRARRDRRHRSATALSSSARRSRFLCRPGADPMSERERLGEAVRLHELAVQERASGRAAAALPSCIGALAILEREHGDPVDVAAVLNTLGVIHEDLSRYGEAEAAFQRAASILAEVEGDDEVLGRVRVQTLANRARLERVQGRLDEAERLFLEALAVAEAAFGAAGGELPPLLNDLAVVYKYAARFDEAKALYRRALAAVEAALGPEHPEAATIWHNLGGIEHARGRFAEGEVFAQRSVEIREAALGADHPAVAADVAALAALVQEQGRLDEAEALYCRAVTVFEAALGPDHYELAVNCNNLGALQAARGQAAEAEALYRRALRIKEALLGLDHPDVAMTVHNLAVLRAGQGRAEEAETLFRRALGIFEASLGAAHPKSRACRRELELLLGAPRQ